MTHHDDVGHDQFSNMEDHDWMVQGDKAGSARSWNGFTFLQVNNAGHMVPMDQPVNALAMVETFINGGSF